MSYHFLKELHTLLSRRLSNSFGTAEDIEDPGLTGTESEISACVRLCPYFHISLCIWMFTFNFNFWVRSQSLLLFSSLLKWHLFAYISSPSISPSIYLSISFSLCLSLRLFLSLFLYLSYLLVTLILSPSHPSLCRNEGK